MRRYYFFVVVLMFGISIVNAQDRIVYHVNQEIEQQIKTVIAKLKVTDDQVFGIWATDRDTTSILIAVQKGSGTEFLIKNSNRVLKLHETEIPLLSNADLVFSEQAMSNVIGKNGKPRIRTTIFTISGYIVRIKGNRMDMKWIDTKYFQF